MKKIFLIGFSLLMLAGCATNGDIEKLQTQINEQNDRIITLTSKVDTHETKINDLAIVYGYLRDDIVIVDRKINIVADKLFKSKMLK